MRPRRPSVTCRYSRLLRPRGDAPLSQSGIAATRAAAPPARRCAAVGPELTLLEVGCSARAEMRPTDAESRPSPPGAAPPARRCARWRECVDPASPGLLRPRGDAPTQSIGTNGATKAAPPARRCAAWGGGVSYALPGLLRPRGDAPRLKATRKERGLAAPPARRCAADPRRSGPGARGCSARAEMRRRTPRGSDPACRLLRPRGDAPQTTSRPWPRTSAAPPARRCAPPSTPTKPCTLGCSARAEMRPYGTTASTVSSGLLRPRGDAPQLAAQIGATSTAAPPARRCARFRGRGVTATLGCSARAEMRRSGSSGTRA